MAGDITTATGAKIFIGPSVAASAADTLTELKALTYVEIGLVESLGEFGDEASAVTFAALGDGRIRKAKGARDAGMMAITVAHTPEDTGQAAIEAAEQTNNNYAFKVVLPDSPANDWSDTTIYFRGLVMSRRKNIGTNDNVIRNTYNVGVNSELFTELAVDGTP